MAASIAKTTTTAIAGDLSPKNTADHRKFKVICVANAANRALLSDRVHALQKEMPIKMYRHVQTGPNTQFGGFPGGLGKLAYQPLSIAENVITPPPAEAAMIPRIARKGTRIRRGLVTAFIRSFLRAFGRLAHLLCENKTGPAVVKMLNSAPTIGDS